VLAGSLPPWRDAPSGHSGAGFTGQCEIAPWRSLADRPKLHRNFDVEKPQLLGLQSRQKPIGLLPRHDGHYFNWLIGQFEKVC
jgi:hypothetical protein